MEIVGNTEDAVVRQVHIHAFDNGSGPGDHLKHTRRFSVSVIQ